MRTITEDGVTLYRNMVNNMLAKEHLTVWTGKEEQFMIFTTISPETATKAIRVLREAGLLCSTDIGSVKPMVFIKEH